MKGFTWHLLLGGMRTTNAKTSPPSHYMITITFNTDKLGRPALSVARTMMHEMIHAEIFRKMLSLAGKGKIDLNENQVLALKNDFPGIYDYYLRYKADPENPSDSIPGWQHQQMAAHYREIIEDALREFDNNSGNPVGDDDVYEALAWSGLMGGGDNENAIVDPTTGLIIDQNTGDNLSTRAWEDDLNASERSAIVDKIKNFENNNPPCQ